MGIYLLIFPRQLTGETSPALLWIPTAYGSFLRAWPDMLFFFIRETRHSVQCPCPTRRPSTVLSPGSSQNRIEPGTPAVLNTHRWKARCKAPQPPHLALKKLWRFVSLVKRSTLTVTLSVWLIHMWMVGCWSCVCICWRKCFALMRLLGAIIADKQLFVVVVIVVVVFSVCQAHHCGAFNQITCIHLLQYISLSHKRFISLTASLDDWCALDFLQSRWHWGWQMVLSVSPQWSTADWN